MALPWLEGMARASQGDPAAAVPRRLVAIETNMGILPQFFFPDRPGRDSRRRPTWRSSRPCATRSRCSRGSATPGVTGGHAAEQCFLTGTPHPERGGFRNGISLDQFAAEQIGDRTRYPSLVLAMSNEGNMTLSYTRSGAPISAERSPKKLYQRLFLQGRPEEVAANVEALRQDRSLLDFVGRPVAAARPVALARDRGRLDQYYTSVRELEQRLDKAEAWEHHPKPKVHAQAARGHRGRARIRPPDEDRCST